MAELDARIQTLLDREEINDVLRRYTRGVDRVDRALVRGCFHDDAQLDFGIFAGTAAEVYAAKARGEQSSDTAGWAQLTAHYLTNVTIDIAGDVAASEAYCIAMHRTSWTSAQIGFVASNPELEVEGTLRDIIAGARYVDRFERRDGVNWKIARRTEVWEWTRIEPVGNHWVLDERFTIGRRDGTDVVFRPLA